jgi:hypothetical protein
VDILGNPIDLSMGLAHIFLAEARGLTDLPPAAVESDLRRVLTRQRGERLSIAEGREQASRLAPDLAALTTALHRHYTDGLASEEGPEPGPQALAKWLLLARFLAQGGGEE